MHENGQGSDDWVINDPKNAPAFRMAREGWDVWMGNNRGNAHSISHLDMLYTSGEYWDNHDFEEMGVYDVPAFIEQILTVTGKESID